MTVSGGTQMIRILESRKDLVLTVNTFVLEAPPLKSNTSIRSTVHVQLLNMYNLQRHCCETKCFRCLKI